MFPNDIPDETPLTTHFKSCARRSFKAVADCEAAAVRSSGRFQVATPLPSLQLKSSRGRLREESVSRQ